ncbi:hypothetical protein BU14_0269s0003 [Porphyra umbilicalis]|uniref:Uncharacterized protein n=1 Tax=Porphyra umbilicalis TaxID=2786 RepID=A0A1X6P262_PORUM|nr:hypothetical protein BU14_0269s0003 [Porphyra umbilicalis]|eukprot:OSX74723.1 hypothetical protein BU14_0269s0003 [Porphyra umbilicalis]
MSRSLLRVDVVMTMFTTPLLFRRFPFPPLRQHHEHS